MRNLWETITNYLLLKNKNGYHPFKKNEIGSRYI
jgi:hypothetical protein